jgi:hypothetical protein
MASGLRHKEESLGADTRGSLLLLSERFGNVDSAAC